MMNWQPGWKPIGEPTLDPPDETSVECYDCRKQVYNGDFEEIDGQTYCEDCYGYCLKCGRIVVAVDAEYINEEWVCVDCLKMD